ncbi:MAG: site-2 protease family protein, partial [Oscillospiraceae bacterium]|nr:site-2 protease family protein [Oscillospiraceae bacterium]
MLFLYLNGTPLLTCLLYLVVLIFSATVHEVAHAWAAYKLGDPTAKHMGRISLNPKVHLTKMGTLAMLLLPIGWANPVMVNPQNFRKPKRDGMLVSIAGPLSNLLLCFISLLILVILAKFPSGNTAFSSSASEILWVFAHLNSLLMIFNLLP